MNGNPWAYIVKIFAVIVFIIGIIFAAFLAWQAGVAGFLFIFLPSVAASVLILAVVMTIVTMADDTAAIRYMMENKEPRATAKNSKITCPACDKKYSSLFEDCPHCKHSAN